MAVEVATPQAIQLCSEAIAKASMGWAEWARLFLLFLTAMGAWGIAAVNWRSQKLQRTSELVRMASLDSTLAERLSRIYLYRRRDQGYPDPYTDQTSISFEHDLIVVLNFFETVCIEIIEGLVSRRKIQEHMGYMVVGAEPLLEDLAQAQGTSLEEQENDYKVLVSYIKLWKAQPIPLPRPTGLSALSAAFARRNRWIE